MHTTITSKYQTTIPKSVRDAAGLSINDTLEWEIEDGKIIVSLAHSDFLCFKNSVRVGNGEIDDDIEVAKRLRVERKG